MSAALLQPVDARGGHGFGEHGFGEHGFGAGGMRARRSEALAVNRRHGNEEYVKAASAERDRLLNTKLKSICRGC